MKLSMSFAQSIIDEVQSGAELYEVQLLLNKFLAAKVEPLKKYDPTIEFDGSIEEIVSIDGDFIKIQDLLTDN